MKQLSQLPLCRKMTAIGGKLCRYHLGHECDLTLSLYADDSAQTPECSHRITGSGRHNLLAVVGLFGSVALLITLFGCVKRLLCCLFHD